MSYCPLKIFWRGDLAIHYFTFNNNDFASNALDKSCIVGSFATLFMRASQ
jgi:hypothetical protein